jgi:hypothetical protein
MRSSVSLLVFVLVFSAGVRGLAADEYEAPAKRAERLRTKLRAERAQLLKELDNKQEVVNYLRRWVVTDPTQKKSVIQTDVTARTPHLKRLRDRKEILLNRITEFPWKSRGSVVKGTALNAMLDVAGEMAAQFVESKDFRDATKDRLEPRDARRVESFREVIDSIKLTPQLIKRIQTSQGLTGPKIAGRINQGPLQLEWPLVLRSSRYKSHRDEITKLRNKAVEKLKEGNGLDLDAVLELKQAVDQLYKAVHADEKRMARNKADVAEWMLFHKATLQADRLRYTVLRFGEADTLEDVQPPAFEGETIEDLIAWMHVNAVRFAPADTNGEIAYQQIFRMMTRYYVEMQFQSQMLERPLLELQRLESIDSIQELGERVLFNREYDAPLLRDELKGALDGL